MQMFTLTAGRYSAAFTDAGASWVSFKVDDREVLLGFDDPAAYIGDIDYIGNAIGRFANRIRNAQFTLGGKDITLNANTPPNHLHGGIKGFNRFVWNAKQEGNSVTFTRTSPDGEENYPGNLGVAIKYTLTDDGSVAITYTAVTDAPTIVNLTNHAYFNLDGGGSLDDHIFTINSDYVCNVDELIPDGSFRAVKGSVFDLNEGRRFGDALRDGASDPMFSTVGGYDHCFRLNHHGSCCGLTEVARAASSGLELIVSTDLPAIQLYTGNMLSGLTGRGGQVYAKHTGFCMETQEYPDAPNRPEFGSCLLLPGEVLETTTAYRLVVK